MKAILSIKPKYADKIMSGDKKYELRKKLFKRPVDTIYVYVTKPIKKVMFSFEVGQILCDTPYNLWRAVGTLCGVEKKDFFNYFKDVNYGIAIEIKQVEKLANPFCLKTPPQNLIYINKGEDLFMTNEERAKWDELLKKAEEQLGKLEKIINYLKRQLKQLNGGNKQMKNLLTQNKRFEIMGVTRISRGCPRLPLDAERGDFI